MSDEFKSNAAARVSAGISFGSALAIAISFNEYRSISWTILHGICSWLFVIWFALVK